MTGRLTKVDWDLINSALALLEAEIESGYGAPGEVHEGIDGKRLRETREKVHARLDRHTSGR